MPEIIITIIIGIIVNVISAPIVNRLNKIPLSLKSAESSIINIFELYSAMFSFFLNLIFGIISLSTGFVYIIRDERWFYSVLSFIFSACCFGMLVYTFICVYNVSKKYFQERRNKIPDDSSDTYSNDE